MERNTVHFMFRNYSGTLLEHFAKTVHFASEHNFNIVVLFEKCFKFKLFGLVGDWMSCWHVLWDAIDLSTVSESVGITIDV